MLFIGLCVKAICGEMISTETFGGFDWGSTEKNIQHHGTAQPPKYDLSSLTDWEHGPPLKITDHDFKNFFKFW